MSQAPIIIWLRQSLRLHDNPIIAAAAKTKQPIIFAYILDTTSRPWQMGSASKWWLHHSLVALNADLTQYYKAKLVIKQGEPLKVLEQLIKHTQADAVYWDRCYEPSLIERDTRIKATLKDKGIIVESFNTSLLHEPWEYQSSTKSNFKVFTPFWRNCAKLTKRDPASFSKTLNVYSKIDSDTIDSLNLLPQIPWDTGFKTHWQPGEIGAKANLARFLKQGIKNYKEKRNYPATQATSLLSPHLHFGEISPIQIWHACAAIEAKHPEWSTDIQHFLSEIAWREFSYHLLYYHPDLPDQPFKAAFNQFKWSSEQHLRAWQRGLTGYPIVDAGMRELWHTGWMHNRVRMIVASFLTKHLLIPWQQGEAWFWDTLVDADLANNAASWQWVAGCGADAAPYFRIFNPILQGEKFDPEGEYIRRWIPELTALSNDYIHAPWTTPEAQLRQAKIKLGKDYPEPIIEHQHARVRALERYKDIKK